MGIIRREAEITSKLADKARAEVFFITADLRGADLRWTDLRADLDFAGYELSCKTIGIKADKRLVSQLLYHLCRMDVQDCPEWDELRNDGRIIDLANKSHVIDDYDLPEIEQTNAQEDK
jgi:hypothetical protein